MALRSEVLRLYSRVLRLSRSWVATNPVETGVEREYMESEAKLLFRYLSFEYFYSKKIKNNIFICLEKILVLLTS